MCEALRATSMFAHGAVTAALWVKDRAVDPDTGERYNRIWQLPNSPEDLKQRRMALEAWTGLSCEFLGRAPDHVASCISGMVMGIERFERYDKVRAENLRNYYLYARDNDLYLTYVIINPQADRSKSTGEQADEFLTAGIAAEDDEGTTTNIGSGTRMRAAGLYLSVPTKRGTSAPVDAVTRFHLLMN